MGLYGDCAETSWSSVGVAIEQWSTPHWTLGLILGPD